MTMQVRNVTVVPEGDGVDVKRLFPLRGFMNFDPFVLWDHFDIAAGRGFPEHPHRGFEAITYMFDGGMNHKDNLGNESFVTQGGAQRFTAGSGLLHSEMPAESGKSMGIQLWINLPQRLKKISPDYQQVDSAEFPVKEIDGGSVKTLVGDGSPLVLKTDVSYQHIKLNKNAEYSVDIKAGMRGIVYLMKGALTVSAKQVAGADSEAVNADQALFIENTEQLNIKSTENSELMLCFGMPHGEPIRQHGPFVD